MIVNDPRAQKLLSQANSDELFEKVALYPDDEIDGMSDLEIVIDEIEYLIWMYEEDDTLQYQDLQYSKKVLKDTDNGTSMPLDDTLSPRYKEYEVTAAKETVAEYNRLKKIIKAWYHKS